MPNDYLRQKKKKKPLTLQSSCQKPIKRWKVIETLNCVMYVYTYISWYGNVRGGRRWF